MTRHVKPGEIVEVLTGEVMARDFQRWAAAVGDLNPLYFDAEFARANGHRDVVMPPMFLPCVTSQPTFLDALRPDGTRKGRVAMGPLPEDLDLPPRRMGGGDRRWFYRCVHPGDVITSRREITGIEEKAGKSGPLVVVTWETIDRTRDGDLVGRCVSSMIAR